MQTVLVAHDGSRSSDKALKMGLEIAVKFDAALVVLSVVPELYLTELPDTVRNRIYESLNEESRKAMERIRKMLSGKALEVKTVIRQGDPAEVILDTAKKVKAGLIVTGSHGRHGAKKFLLGSVSSKIIDYAPVPVLVTK